MKVLISGGLGHIGSSLIRELPKYLNNLEIVIVDNMLTQRYSSLFHLPCIGDFNFIEGDIKCLDIDEVLDDIDVVIHLAAITDAAGSFEKAKEVEENNFKSTEKLVEACTRKKAKLITLSSTSVYGTQKDQVDENCPKDDLQPQSPYAETKLKEESLVREWVINHGLESITLRFGTIFGASRGMRFHTAVNKFCWQASLGKPITVWRTALNQKRPYLDLLDATSAIVHIIQNNLFDGELYNVVTKNATVQDIIDEISLVHSNLEIEYVDNKIMNQLSYNVSSEKFRNTGFEVRGSLRRGIRETLDLLKQSCSLKD
ncbi:SDR family oxidoreductase [Prochlorococcus sp. MIT 1307]|uniref:NAD-dependent epimerase/dehydratase family protein n=1 Tax=Prochlorococcus sp. MIT 1307 TaxID=3096219 RepID=UPI002A749C79|nr:SDR family oxidoreductase [Prochlorococcus sp. MIT 1307]